MFFRYTAIAAYWKGVCHSSNGVKRGEVTAFIRPCMTNNNNNFIYIALNPNVLKRFTCIKNTETMEGSNKRKSSVEPLGMNGSSFQYQTIYVSFPAITTTRSR